MEELKLNFIRNDDDSLVELNAGQHRVATQKAGEMAMALNEIRKGLRDNTLTKSYAESLLHNLGYYLRDLGKPLDYASAEQKEADERTRLVREANQQNHLLRQQLGEKVSSEDVREKVKNLKKSFYSWFRTTGFAHVSEFWVEEYGATVKLCLNQFSGSERDWDSDENTVDGRKKLADQGYLFLNDNRDKPDDLEDCDSNRQRLIELIAGLSPSARITSFENHVYNHSKNGRQCQSFSIWSMTVIFYDLSQLPQ